MSAFYWSAATPGGILDFPADLVRFTIVAADVPLISIETGHVGVPVRFPAGSLPALTETAIARAEAGAEVTACDEDTERLLIKEHRALAVIRDGGTSSASEASSTCSEEDAENYVTFLESETEEIPVSKPTRRRLKKRRMRAEPFFRECLPGWRARAHQDLFSPARPPIRVGIVQLAQRRWSHAPPGGVRCSCDLRWAAGS